jgi:hypothetical protein
MEIELHSTKKQMPATRLKQDGCATRKTRSGVIASGSTGAVFLNPINEH